MSPEPSEGNFESGIFRMDWGSDLGSVSSENMTVFECSYPDQLEISVQPVQDLWSD